MIITLILPYANGVCVCLQKKIRKDPEPVKPYAAATVVGSKRPTAAAAKAPICKLQQNQKF